MTKQDSIKDEITALLNSDDDYASDNVESASSVLISIQLKLWKRQNSSTLCAALGNSLKGHSTYAAMQAIIKNVEVQNGHNPQINTLVHADIYRVSNRHFYGTGEIGKDNFGLFAIAKESRAILRVSHDKNRSTQDKPVWTTTSEQYPFMHNDVLYQNIKPGRIIVRGLRQLGVNHYDDNKADGSDICLEFALAFNAKDIAGNPDKPVGVFAHL